MNEDNAKTVKIGRIRRSIVVWDRGGHHYPRPVTYWGMPLWGTYVGYSRKSLSDLKELRSRIRWAIRVGKFSKYKLQEF